MSVTAPVVSVVLPTYRRPDALRRALTALAAQEWLAAPWEIVVVDNDRQCSARSAVESADPGPALAIRYVAEAAAGAGAARNAGIRAARGEVIAFCDDDVEPSPNWLGELVGPILDGNADGVAGRVELDWDEVGMPPWLPPAFASYLAYFAPYDADTELGPTDYLLTANAALRADLLRKIGGFDPVLGPRRGMPIVNDDVDLYRRFRSAGGRMRYRPSAVVVHELPASRLRRSYFLKRLYGQGRADFLLERTWLVRTTSRGLKAGVYQLCDDLRALRRGVGSRQTVTLIACHIARFVGFVRESLASFGPRWSGRTPAVTQPMSAPQPPS